MFNGFSAVPGAIVPYAYDWLLVGLSYLISVAGAYVGLRWSRRIRNTRGNRTFRAESGGFSEKPLFIRLSR